jgi:hypothetical protein
MPAEDIWVRDPFASPEPAPEARIAGRVLPEAAADASGAVSHDLIERIAAAGDGRGVTALLADSGGGASPLYALIAARALARNGRAILVQAGPDRRLDEALAGHSAEGRVSAPHDRWQPGLAQLLAGEAAFAEAIYRDGESRLHLLASGGRLDADAEDLRTVIDVLRATYDFLLIAVGADALGLDLARQADAVVILGPASARRDDLCDDFGASGARDVILAAPDFNGQLTAGAA